MKMSKYGLTRVRFVGDEVISAESPQIPKAIPAAPKSARYIPVKGQRK